MLVLARRPPAMLRNSWHWSSALRELWIKSHEHPSPDVPDGPITHAYFVRPWLPNAKVTVEGYELLSRSSHRASVAVRMTVRGDKRRCRVSLVWEDGSWHVDDIDYGNGHSYVATLKEWGGL